MRQIKERYSQKINTPSFLLVRKENPFYKVGEEYSIIEDCNGNFLKQVVIVDIEKIPFTELTQKHSFLDKNTTLEIYKDILKMYNIKETDNLNAITVVDKSILL